MSAEPDSLGSIEGATSEICVPLFDEGEAVGLLDLESLEGADGERPEANDGRVRARGSGH